MDFIQSPISLGVSQVHITLPPGYSESQSESSWPFRLSFPRLCRHYSGSPMQLSTSTSSCSSSSSAMPSCTAWLPSSRWEVGSQLARKGGGRALQVGGEPLGPSCVLCAARLRVQSGWVLAPEVLWESHVLEVECFWNTLWKPVASRNYWVLKMWLVQVEISCKNLEFAIPPKRVKLWWAGLKTEAWKKWKWNSNTLLLHKANI